MNAVLEVKDLVVRRSGRTILNIDYVAINDGEVLAVIGPNGAGKSTLLLSLAQLIQPDDGEVLFRGKAIKKKDSLTFRRRIGLVLQDPLLLDTSVINNVTIGLRFHKVPRGKRKQIAREWLDKFGIGRLENRPAKELSGGEAQRVSLARAFALNPDVLLLDEPFSALDAPTRAKLLADFQALLAHIAMTTCFVTHDMDEAMALGDQVAILMDGRLQQVGHPEDVFSKPVNVDVADFVGVETTVAGKVVADDNGQVVIDAKGLHLEAVGQANIGRSVLVCVRPEDVTVWAGGDLPPSSARNQLKGSIQKMTPKGPLVKVDVDCGISVSALITRTSAREMALIPGDDVTLTIKASALHLIPR
jgi:tungstate transport system ATP-binding protein